jgi:hypothetical protein
MSDQEHKTGPICSNPDQGNSWQAGYIPQVLGRLEQGRDDESDRRGPHARGNVVAAACGTASALTLRDRAYPAAHAVPASAG